ncbi:hypothetical protein SK3146_02864 [Paenibacillus konkukensis]|uniref:Uncharacterized protein n=1 Tax=Paenibacillus konkukensis TaxID=2020716 RepID=A0ABY4RNM0_9BACL|nr:hypothetical protein SK3146_02864 [Paenibacillus konkukensis]
MTNGSPIRSFSGGGLFLLFGNCFRSSATLGDLFVYALLGN